MRKTFFDALSKKEDRFNILRFREADARKLLHPEILAKTEDEAVQICAPVSSFVF
jgi:hypothetical protein